VITLGMWQNLARMGACYAELGFQDLPQPWVASHEATHATLPSGVLPCELNGQILVGSAEQAFIDRMLTHQMPQGRWQATTPCFRNEPVLDALHKPYFIKLELIHYMPSMADAELETMILQVRWVLGTLIPDGGPTIKIEPTDIGWDLTLHGQEIGSYGIREYAGHRWIYGTGIAEPRFTTIVCQNTD